MKFLFIILFPASLVGQVKTITADSSWITNQNGVFYRTQQVQYSTGEKVITESPIGDTATTYTKFKNEIEAIANRFADDVERVAAYRQQITELIRFGKEVPNTIGLSPLDSLRNGTDLLETGWKVDGAAISFRVNNAGNFQWKYDTLQDWTQAAYLGGVIRLNNFNGYNTDFFRRSNNRWITANNRNTIRRPGDIAARVAVSEEETPPPAPPQTELLAGGIVRIGEIQYKFNARKKKWEITK